MPLTANKFIIPNGSPASSEQPMQSTGIGPTEVNRKSECGSIVIRNSGPNGFVVPSSGAWAVAINNKVTSADYGPNGVSDSIWDASNARMQFSGLSLGDYITFRAEGVVQTTANNQDIDARLFLAEGTAGELELPLWSGQFKSVIGFPYYYAGAEITFAMESTDVLSNYGQLKMKTLSSASANVWITRFVFAVTKRNSSY